MTAVSSSLVVVVVVVGAVVALCETLHLADSVAVEIAAAAAVDEIVDAAAAAADVVVETVAAAEIVAVAAVEIAGFVDAVGVGDVGDRRTSSLPKVFKISNPKNVGVREREEGEEREKP